MSQPTSRPVVRRLSVGGTRRAWAAHIAHKVVPTRLTQPLAAGTRCGCADQATCGAFDQRIPAVQCVDAHPVPKPRQTQRDKFAKRPSVVRYRAFADQLRAAGVVLPHRCVCICYMPMPASWSASRRQQAVGQPHRAKPDFDNLGKAICDATTPDDQRLDDVRVLKRWAWTGRVVVLNPIKATDVFAAVDLHAPGPSPE